MGRAPAYWKGVEAGLGTTLVDSFGGRSHCSKVADRVVKSISRHGWGEAGPGAGVSRGLEGPCGGIDSKGGRGGSQGRVRDTSLEASSG
ncbi:hypothetical protein ACLOJK_031911 [Asimina triloba]